MRDLCCLIWFAVVGLIRSRVTLQAEILVLRHQLVRDFTLIEELAEEFLPSLLVA